MLYWDNVLGLNTILRQCFRPKYYSKTMFRLKVSTSKALKLFQYWKNNDLRPVTKEIKKYWTDTNFEFFVWYIYTLWAVVLMFVIFYKVFMSIKMLMKSNLHQIILILGFRNNWENKYGRRSFCFLDFQQTIPLLWTWLQLHNKC